MSDLKYRTPLTVVYELRFQLGRRPGGARSASSGGDDPTFDEKSFVGKSNKNLGCEAPSDSLALGEDDECPGPTSPPIAPDLGGCRESSADLDEDAGVGFFPRVVMDDDGIRADISSEP